MATKYRLMSSDGHLEVPPERWTHRVPEKYRDRAPRTVRLPDGGDALLIEGQPLRESNFLDLRAGQADADWTPFGVRVEDAAGAATPGAGHRWYGRRGVVSGPGRRTRFVAQYYPR